MTITIVSLAPVLFFLLVLKFLDSFALVKWKFLLSAFSYGLVCCLAVYFIAYLAGTIEIGRVSVFPLIEEIFKAAAMVYVIRSRKIRFLAEALIYGATIGGGFSMLENIIYIVSNPDMLTGTAIFRGFSCALLHMGCTALISTLLILSADRKPSAAFVPLCFIPSAVLHFAHNLILEHGAVQPMIMMFCVIITFIILFLSIFRMGESRIYKWMDHSISEDIQTLSSIKQGNFSSTKAGLYLLGVKERFKPEVFFDMIMYVELQLEQKIERQSQMLMAQAGYEIPGDSAEKFEAKSRELIELKKNIGKTGLRVLFPVVQDRV